MEYVNDPDLNHLRAAVRLLLTAVQEGQAAEATGDPPLAAAGRDRWAGAQARVPAVRERPDTQVGGG